MRSEISITTKFSVIWVSFFLKMFSILLCLLLPQLHWIPCIKYCGIMFHPWFNIIYLFLWITRFEIEIRGRGWIEDLKVRSLYRILWCLFQQVFYIIKLPLPLYPWYPPNIMGIFFNKFAKDFALGKCFGHGLYQNQIHIWFHRTL